jgi:hypothetical protein
VRRRLGVVAPIGLLLLLLGVWVSSRPASDRQAATGEKPSPASQPLSEQGRAVAQVQVPSAKVNAWGMLLQVMPRLDDPVATNSLRATFQDLTLVDFAVSALESENNKERPASADRISNVLRVLKAQVAAFRREQDDSDEAPPRTVSLRDIRTTCEQVKALYESAVLVRARALAERCRCPMHPEVIGIKGAICPKCGMPLETEVRLSVSGLESSLSLRATIKARVETDAPLQIGKEARSHLSLWGPEGEPVTPDELAEVHTQRIHLLIIDDSFTDYHHEHPVPTNVAGRYDFSFTPRKPGTYLVWADVQPYLTGPQEYAMTVIPAVTPQEPLRKTVDQLDTTVNGLHYAIRFQQPVKAGEAAMGTLHVTQTDGSGFNRLEPVMGAFAHLVGFHENHTNVLHIHPEMSQPPAPNDRGGPNLRFRLFAGMPGFFRLFVQIQRDGSQQFASFALNVAPGNTPWIDEEPAHLD